MVYQVLYYGQLKPGVSLAETITKLAKITGFTPEKAEQHFFAGRAVKLKVFTLETEAQAFIEKLLSHGIIAELDILSPTLTSPTLTPPTQTSPTQNDNPLERNRSQREVSPPNNGQLA